MNDITQDVKVTLSEMTECNDFHESFCDLLQDKVEEAIGRELSFWQVVNYEIVGCDVASVVIRVYGYEEDA